MGCSLREIQIKLNKFTKDCQEYSAECSTNRTQIQGKLP